MQNVKLALAAPKSPNLSQIRARDQFRSINRDNQMEPNDFFGGGFTGTNESSLLDDAVSDSRQSRNLSFAETTNTNYQESSEHEEDSEDIFDPMLNLKEPGFITRMRLYLKPKDGSVSMQFLLLIADTVLALIYITAQLSYVLSGSYDDEQDKLVQLLIAFGVTGAVFCYCFADGARFLRSWPDRILYFISCLLQKPILLPVLLPGSFFKSYVANGKFGGETLLRIDNVHMTTFMLAVQEANFLYSFTLAAFSALATFLSSH